MYINYLIIAYYTTSAETESFTHVMSRLQLHTKLAVWKDTQVNECLVSHECCIFSVLFNPAVKYSIK